MNKLNKVIKKSDRKTVGSSFKQRAENGSIKKMMEVVPANAWKFEVEMSKNSKWSSRFSNDSAFCSTETAIVDSFAPLDDDHETSDLILNLEDRMESIDTSKSTEELSQCRLSLDGSSCVSLPNQLSHSLLSVSEKTSKKASLENLCSSSLQKKNFKRSTSYEAEEEQTTHVSFRQKIKNMTKRSKQLMNVTRQDASPSSFSNEIDAQEIWATKNFLSGSELDFQVREADVFLKAQLLNGEESADIKIAVLIPTKTETSDNSEYQKCQLRTKVIMQSKPIHLFIFENLLVIAKQRFLGMSHVFRMKERILLVCAWISCDQLHPNISTQCPMTLGWSQRQIKTSSVLFDSLQDKLTWMRVFNRHQELVAKSYEEAIVIKVFCDDKEHGERTKKISVRRKETIDEVMKKVPEEFFPSTSKESLFQFSLKYVGDADKYLLTGSENLYAIQLASDRKLLNNEVEYFSIVPMKSGSFLKKTSSWKRSKQLIVSDLPINHTKTDKKSIIGRNLHDIFHNGELPKVLLNLLRYLYEHGPQADGIFRKSSSQKEVQSALEALEGFESKEFISEMKPCVASSVLKTWLKSMPDCLLVGENYYKWLEAAKADEIDRVQKIKALVDQLPKENHLVLSYLICVLRHVADSSDENKMTPHNLAVCLGPSILSPSTVDFLNDYEKEADSRKIANVVIESMINHAKAIIGEDRFSSIFQQSNDSPRHETGETEVISNSGEENFSSIELVPDYSPDKQAYPDSNIIEDSIPENLSPHLRPPTDTPFESPEDVPRNRSYSNTSNASEKRRNFVSQSIGLKHIESDESVNKTNSLLFHSGSSNPEIETLDSHRSLSTKSTLLIFSEYCKKPSNVLKKTQRRRATMPDPRDFRFHSNNVNKAHNANCGKPRYIVEIFINSNDDVNPPANRISYRQSIKTSKPEEASKIPEDVENHAIQCDSVTSRQTRFKTTIYLGPDRTSTIEEPPRCSKIQAYQQKLIPRRNNCSHHHEHLIKQNSLLKLKYNNPHSIDHY